MSESEIKCEICFEALCSSTNNENCNSVVILKQYFMSTVCSEIKIKDNNQVSFKHTLTVGNNNTNVDCNNNYIEINSSSKNVQINDDTDCYIIFFDLEYIDSLSELYKICKKASEIGISDKKFYIISIYTDENSKNDDKTEEIKKCLKDSFILEYDISEVNMASKDELANKIDKITLECLQEKNLINSDIIKNYDRSRSGCLII